MASSGPTKNDIEAARKALGGGRIAVVKDGNGILYLRGTPPGGGS